MFRDVSPPRRPVRLTRLISSSAALEAEQRFFILLEVSSLLALPFYLISSCVSPRHALALSFFFQGVSGVRLLRSLDPQRV